MSRRSSQRSASPQISTSSGDRSRSRLSPTRLTRIQEKEELQNLNDRLATYIDTVRHLETENNRLSVQIRNTQETVTKEVTNIKTVYEKELSGIRKVLDETAKEKAKLQIAGDKWKLEAKELSEKLSKKTKDLASSEKKLKSSEFHNQDLQRQLNQILPENKKLEALLKEAEGERDVLAQQLSALKRELERETLARVDLENRLQSSKEELSFKESIHKQEIRETRLSKETAVTEIDTQLRESYEQRLADTLKELREQYEVQMKVNRDEIESIYESKLIGMQSKMDKVSNASSNYCDELRSLKTKMECMNTKNNNLEMQISSLQNRVKDLEKLLEQEREWHASALQVKDEDLQRLKEEMDNQIAEYQDLLDIKIALDLEIAAYNKLLEGEEMRLNMSPSSTPANSPQALSTSMRSAKRKRTTLSGIEKSSKGVKVSHKAKGDIEISEQDMLGKYVTIFNKGSTEQMLAGWHLVQQADNQEIKYKFPRGALIKPHSSITVWSLNSGTTHSPPQNYLMKNLSWLSSNSMMTVLLNTNGEEMASKESVNVSESSGLQLISEH